MKKNSIIVVVVGFIVLVNSCKSLDYPQPEFNKPFTYIIDSKQIRGSCEDYVVLQNESRDSNIRFNVYVHDPRKGNWELVQLGNLKGAGDTHRLKSSDLKDIDNYRYFAIESLNNKSYTYIATKKRNDLYIAIQDK